MTTQKTEAYLLSATKQYAQSSIAQFDMLLAVHKTMGNMPATSRFGIYYLFKSILTIIDDYEKKKITKSVCDELIKITIEKIEVAPL